MKGSVCVLCGVIIMCGRQSGSCLPLFFPPSPLQICCLVCFCLSSSPAQPVPAQLSISLISCPTTIPTAYSCKVTFKIQRIQYKSLFCLTQVEAAVTHISLLTWSKRLHHVKLIPCYNEGTDYYHLIVQLPTEHFSFFLLFVLVLRTLT